LAFVSSASRARVAFGLVEPAWNPAGDRSARAIRPAYVLTLADGNAHELAVHAGYGRSPCRTPHRAEAVEIDRQSPVRAARDSDGTRAALADFALPAAPELAGPKPQTRGRDDGRRGPALRSPPPGTRMATAKRSVKSAYRWRRRFVFIIYIKVDDDFAPNGSARTDRTVIIPFR